MRSRLGVRAAWAWVAAGALAAAPCESRNDDESAAPPNEGGGIGDAAGAALAGAAPNAAYGLLALFPPYVV